MRDKRFRGCLQLLLAGLAVVTSLAIGASRAQAQTAGDNAVYPNSAAACCSASQNAIDASVVDIGTTSGDICNRIFIALGLLPASGGVVDARGITGTNVGCTSNSVETPWTINGSTIIRPAVILLPATTITILYPWIMPGQNKIIGEGAGMGTTLPATVIQAASNFPTAAGTAMLQMGSTPSSGISIESVTLAGGGHAVNGILNSNAGTGSYVSNVFLSRILGVGLQVDHSASNSGPYSNIVFDTGLNDSSPDTACVKILGLTGTLGVRGLSCLSRDVNATAAVYLYSNNNVIKDVLIQGFEEGILVGQSAKSNVIVNVTDLTNSTQMASTIEIQAGSSVSDLVIMGVSNNCGGANCHAYTILDETAQGLLITNSAQSIALYVLGSSPAAGIFSRFTTSTAGTASGSAPYWVVGNGAPSSVCSVPGSLYSNTSPSGGGGLWVCGLARSPASATWETVK